MLCRNNDGLDGSGLIPGMARFFFLYSVQTGSGALPASYPNGYRGLFSRGVKPQGREADHSPHTSAEVKNTWIYTSTPPYAFMA
jgi:hypothetical protein